MTLNEILGLITLIVLIVMVGIVIWASVSTSRIYRQANADFARAAENFEKATENFEKSTRILRKAYGPPDDTEETQTR
jgi:hypothetical protein